MKEKPKRNPDIYTNMLPDGHIVLVAEKTNWAYTLTPLAALVWEFCDGENSLDDIVNEIRALKDVPANPNLKEEVGVLLQELEDSGFLVEE